MDTLHKAFDWYLDHTVIQWIFLAYGVLFIIERLFGRRNRATTREVVYNCIYLVLLLSLFTVLRPFAAKVASGAADHLGGPFLDFRFDTKETLPLIIAAEVLFLFIYDFFYYWHHRMQHAVPAFWVTHKIHHMDPNLGVTTSYKHHWTDEAARTATILFPMALIFQLEPVTIFWVHYVAAWQGMLIHSNIPLGFGPFQRVITGPRLHRIHHSPLPEHRDCNFAAMFPIFDIIFGTYVPATKETYPTGLDTGEQITSMWWGWMYPFREWYRMIKERFGARLPQSLTPGTDTIR
jgi:sterol desaturase/sphingolipid hydroxylase (fatty acid hydroxylase superfamily)